MQHDKIQSELDPLGPRYRAYQPPLTSLACGFVIGLLLIAGGVAAVGFSLHGAHSENWDLPINVKKGWSWFAVGIFHFLGIVLLYLGFVLANGSRRQVSYSVDLRTDGFRVRSAGNQEDVLWADVQLIQQITHYLRVRGLERLFTEYRVIARSGKEHQFESGTIQGFDEFEKILREVARQRSITWERVGERA